MSANYPGTSPAGVSKTNHDYAIDGDNQTGLAPRLGFAWQMLPNSTSVVLRGGYGVYYSTPPGVATLTSTISPPWIVNLANSGAINPNISLLSPYGPGPFPMASQLPVFTAYSPTTLQSQLQYQNPSFRLGYAQEYNRNLQTDLGHNYLLELGYVGSFVACYYAEPGSFCNSFQSNSGRNYEYARKRHAESADLGLRASGPDRGQH